MRVRYGGKGAGGVERGASRLLLGLAFYLDYRDRLGGKDRFSDGVFTRRQRRYVERLEHHYRVRMFKFPAGSRRTGDTKLRIPDDVPADDLDVNLYVQDRASLVILGAARISLKGEK